MRIVLVSDAWHPQVNGVVHTWTYMQQVLTAWGHELLIVSPAGSRTVPTPSEPDVRLCIEPRRHLLRTLDGREPDTLHIATEGPLGLAARRLARQRGWHHTTSFHTMFPDYLQARLGIPASLTWRFMRWFHRPSQRVLVPTPTVRDKLAAHGLRNLHVWARGVDTEAFRPGKREPLPYPGPVFLSVGRLAKEKNLDAFLSLDLPGTKLVVGGGPDEARLRRKYPDTVFAGMTPHDRLARYYAAADVFVFPSLTDTFGLVMLEAIACGTPVAAYRSEAPLAVVREGLTGILHEDLRQACLRALELPREAVRQEALRHGWTAIAHRLLELQVPANPALAREELDWYPQGAA
ncbi:GDP-mannose-dependent alpha-mannosyltransferase [Pigmentiphaga humi]|uniref:GDP-mannose-dependent alpha-mannosyltransferase n=1 Tax=Pigmentiphaga humi TaxID=2478468 RepID=A0A3P4AWE6_9BURK|nr:glycosyltransferase family 1 protein [Pigmentiphaga humi]VCU68052.1 GDP-mannose-dependent alpha-mannosyltransferase [Pigmentiphaga humi]